MVNCIRGTSTFGITFFIVIYFRQFVAHDLARHFAFCNFGRAKEWAKSFLGRSTIRKRGKSAGIPTSEAVADCAKNVSNVESLRPAWMSTIFKNLPSTTSGTRMSRLIGTILDCFVVIATRSSIRSTIGGILSMN